MPMSLAASLGTCLTLVSAPAFLLANNLLERTGAEGLGIFSITPIGLALVVVGMVYMLLARWLLPKRSGESGDDDYLRLDRYRTELLVVKDSRWNTRPLAELQKALGDKFRMVGWLRDGSAAQRPGHQQPAAQRRHPAGGGRRRMRWRRCTTIPASPSTRSRATAARPTATANRSWCRRWSRRARSSSAAASANWISRASSRR